MADEPIVRAKDRDEWRRWLERHHDTSQRIRLTIAKKGGTVPAVTYAEAVEEALCFGWIDSTAGPLDDSAYLVQMGPRRPGSGWSKVNKDRIARMIAEGKMTPAGRAVIEAAERDGSWAKLDASHALTVPSDLTAAFRRYRDAKGHFDAFPPSARRAILEWVNGAKRPETRSRRVEETARLAAENIRANQARPRKPG